MAESGSLVPGAQPNAPDPEWEEKFRTTLAEGRMLMDSDNRAPSMALPIIMEAVNMCPCDPAGSGKTRHDKDKSCNISQCIDAVRSDNPGALYEVAKRPCACGYSWPSCTRIEHAIALDALAECLTKAGQHVSAFSTALSIIRLDPASAVGYCRTAKILRYLLKKKDPKADSNVARSLGVILRHAKLPSADTLRDVLKQFVSSGLWSTDKYGNGLNDSYDVILHIIAHSLKISAARIDPVQKFPQEVLSMIFAHLDTTSLLKCLRVSKQWHRVVLGDSSLWLDVRLIRPLNPKTDFARFLQQRPGITTLAIYDAADFQVNETKLRSIMYGLRQLKRLYLNSGKALPAIQKLAFKSMWLKTAASLTHLSISGFDSEEPVEALVRLSAKTLQALDLVKTGHEVNEIFKKSPCFPNLKKLRIISGYTPQEIEMHLPEIETEFIVLATPVLEQFHLDGFFVCWRNEYSGPSTLTVQAKNSLWRSLERVILGPELVFSNHAQIWRSKLCRILPPFTSNLRSFEVLGPRCAQIADNVLFTFEVENAGPDWQGYSVYNRDPNPPNLVNLEVFRCRAESPDIVRYLADVIGPAARAGSLKFLELTLPGPISLFRIADPVRELSFAVSENLHTLGLHRFNFYYDRHDRLGTTKAFDGQPFIDWIECFPNLHTVLVYPDEWEAVDLFIMQLIAHPRVKVIHQDVLRGVAWDNAQRLAELHGVELHHTPFFAPTRWHVFED
ncbi:uncharacterized protein B0T15DRAFT_509519 [Chaetomium strumarium]|uniref:F-box domain-containing protein n=1 Tax=Chaetomium strumarium TaxID=1170767 RepID=A0AAJ0GZN4_9PEZI|nr:hypothetical protein B0T15DRAFT_509519 [Chaetomium strumarium]